MRRLTTIQWGLIGAAIVSTVLLGFVRTSPAEGKLQVPVASRSADSHTLDEVIAASRQHFSAELRQKVALIEGAVSTERDFVRRGQMFDSLVRLTGMAKEYAFAAWASEQKAIKNNGSGSDWQTAGERYRGAASFQDDPRNVPALFDAAERCFNKAIELEPKNLDAKVGLATCIVEGSNDPMKGIGMLLDVVNEDSTNVNAQLALGDFSVKRGAPDKAIVRYSTALRLRPDYYGLHLSLAEQFQALGDTAAAISHLEAYVQQETDPLVKNDVENAIRRLRGNPPKQ